MMTWCTTRSTCALLCGTSSTAWHYQCGLTELVEKLAVAAERHVEAKLSGKALQAYRDAGYENDRPITV